MIQEKSDGMMLFVFYIDWREDLNEGKKKKNLVKILENLF